MTSRFITSREVCELLGVSPDALGRMVRDEGAKPPRVNLGSRARACWRWAPDELDAWVERVRTRSLAPMVYVIVCKEARAFKVGVTRDLEARVIKLQVGCPFELTLIRAEPGGEALEARLHEALVDYHMRGEWFRLTKHSARIIDSVWPEIVS